MAATRTTNRGPLAVLVVDVAVLVAAVVAVVVHDDGASRQTSAAPTASTAQPTSTTTTAPPSTRTGSSTSTTTTSPGTSTTTSTTAAVAPSTTALPAVPTPEQAANGLIAAYRAGDRAQAARFATQPVIDVLFAQPYSPPDGAFQGCTPDGDLYQCRYVQPDATYDMTAQRNPSDNSYIIVVIATSRPAASTQSGATTTTTAVAPAP